MFNKGHLEKVIKAAGIKYLKLDRLGKFQLNQSLFETEDKTAFFQLFSEMIPLKIEKDMLGDNRIYTCYSEKFESLKDGDEIPEYEVIVKTIPTINGCRYKISYRKLS